MSQKVDLEGFLPPPPADNRLAGVPMHVGSPEAYAAALAEEDDVPRPCTAEARARGCTCKRSPLNGQPGPGGKAWFFPGMDCPVHGGR